MQEIEAEELLALLIAYSIVDQYQSIAVLDQQASHGPTAHVVLIGRVSFRPHRSGHYTVHGTAVQFEVASIYRVEVHLGHLLLDQI